MRIHTQMALITFGITLLALGVATTLWNDHYRNERRSEIDERLLNEARLVAALLPPPDSLDTFPFEAVIRRIDNEKMVRITIVAPDGTVIAESRLNDAQTVGMDNHANRPEIAAALTDGIGRAVRWSASLGIDMSYVAVPWGPPSGPRGVIRAALPTTRIDAEERRGAIRLLQVLAGAAILASVLGLTITLVVSRPASRMAGVARTIAGGRLDMRIDEEGGAEIRDLARSVNQLADSVERQVHALETERAALDHLLQGMPDGILSMDGDGRILLANRAAFRLLNLAPDCIGRTPVEAIRIGELQMAVDHVRKHRESTALELKLTEPEPKRIAVTLVPVRDGIVAVLSDVTRLRRLEEARREMVANIGHELRTPLTAVLGYVETLEQSPDLPAAERGRFLEIILRNGRRMQRLVSDLSRLSQLETDPKPLALGALSPEELIRSAIETITPRAAARSIEIEAACGDLPDILADRHALDTVLLNLLDNAVRVSPEKGRIRVAGRDEGQYVRIEVADGGPGVPRELRDRVFERFYRLDSGRSPEEGGSGLGLAIVKHIILLHGGQVGVESSPGAGSTFHFTVPKSPSFRHQNATEPA